MSEKILCVRLKSIGDVVFTLPAVNAIQQNHPDCRITFLVSAECAALLEGFKAIQETIILDRAIYRSKKLGQIWKSTCQLFRRLRRGGFSYAIDFQGYGETALLTRMTGARQRLGVVYSRTRALAYTTGVPRDYSIHPIDFNFALLRAGGESVANLRNEFELPNICKERAKEIFRESALKLNRPTIYLQPFTSTAHKNWPLGNYLELALVMRERGRQIVFVAGPSDKQALAPVRKERFPVVVGAPLLVSAALASISDLAIGGDTGLLHLAVAMNKRVVMIMGTNTPGSAHPYRHPEWTVTPKLGTNLSQIKTEAVVEAAEQALAGAADAKAR
ncbi:MAG TPA: glycosyltransferase family 9 protein [Verrucomicrobiae bacterium]